jgi:hypothetical protein
MKPLVLLFVAGAIVSWGIYVPTVHEGGKLLGASLGFHGSRQCAGGPGGHCGRRGRFVRDLRHNAKGRNALAHRAAGVRRGAGRERCRVGHLASARPAGMIMVFVFKPAAPDAAPKAASPTAAVTTAAPAEGTSR